MRSRLFRVLTTALLLMMVLSSTSITAFAKESNDTITGERYEFSEKDDYAVDEGRKRRYKRRRYKRGGGGFKFKVFK